MAERVRSGRGRRPAAEVRAGVLEAAGRLLFEGGIRAVTFDQVAAAAGSSKMTLYKWWPSAGALAAEAYFARSRQVLEFPDTGDIRADLTAQLVAFVRLLTVERAGPIIAELIGRAQTDPDLQAAFSREYSVPRRELAVGALERARERGQLHDDIDLGILVDQLWGACYYRLLIPDAPLDEAYAAALVDNALDGAAPVPEPGAGSTAVSGPEREPPALDEHEHEHHAPARERRALVPACLGEK